MMVYCGDGSVQTSKAGNMSFSRQGLASMSSLAVASPCALSNCHLGGYHGDHHGGYNRCQTMMITMILTMMITMVITVVITMMFAMMTAHHL